MQLKVGTGTDTDPNKLLRDEVRQRKSMNLLTKTCPIVGIVLAVLPASTSYADVGVLPPAAAHAPAPPSTPQVRTARAWHSGSRHVIRPALKAHADSAAFALKPNAFG